MTDRYYDSPVNVLAREIAKTFGGTVRNNPDGELFERFATVAVPACAPMPAYHLGIDRRGYGCKANTVTITISPAERDTNINTRDLNFPKASMNGERPLAAILADISRRVVNHADTLPALRAYAERIQQKKARAAGVLALLAKLQAAFPGLRTSKNFPPTDYEAWFYGFAEGRVRADGSITIERLSLSMDRALAVLALLAEPKTS